VIYLILIISKTFVPNAHVGVGVDGAALRTENDAVVVCTGATWPRDLKIPNRDADGIHFAMEFLQVCHLCFKLGHSQMPIFSSTLSPSWIQSYRMGPTSMQRVETSLSLVVVIPVMTASARLCGMVQNP